MERLARGVLAAVVEFHFHGSGAVGGVYSAIMFGLYGVQMLASFAASHVVFGRERAS